MLISHATFSTGTCENVSFDLSLIALTGMLYESVLQFNPETKYL